MRTPDATKVCTTDDRAAWLKARQPTIGASDWPALLMDPARLPAYLSPAKVWSFGVFGPDERERPNPVAENGLWIEPHLLDRAATLLGSMLTEHGRWLYRSTLYPWLSATLDGWILLPDADRIPQKYAYLRPYAGTWVCVEIKNTSKWSDWDVDTEALYQVPERFWIQVQAQMAVTGLDVVIVVAFVCGRDFHVVPVLRDQAFIDHAVAYTRLFHEAIQASDKSVLGLTLEHYDPAAEALLRRLYPKPKPEVPPVDIPQEFVTAWLRGVAGEQLKAATKVMVLDHMGDASEANATDGHTFKRSKSGALSLRAPSEREN